LSDTDAAEGGGALFRLRTVERDEEQVGQRIKAAFDGTPYKLVQQDLTHGELVPIAAAPAADAEEAAAPADPFAGGHSVDLHLSQAVQAATVEEGVLSALRDVAAAANSGAYQGAVDLIEIVPADAASTKKTNDFVLKATAGVPAADLEAALAGLQQDFQKEPAFEEKTTFDASVAQDTKLSALVAIALSNIAIIFYLWFRFQRATFGVAAVIAVMHDVVIVLGLLAIGALLSGTPAGPILALSDFKIDLAIVAAFLTIIGYSLNDTIVVFDRIREVRGKNPNITYPMVNLSLNQTLSRTLLTSMTTLIVLAILYIMGGEGVHGFSYCMFLGIIVGTYSSIFVASPPLVWLSERMAAPTSHRQQLARTTVST
jgi:SecD/SecF fusion protein